LLTAACIKISAHIRRYVENEEDVVTCELVAECTGFERNGDVEMARQLYDEMLAAGMQPNQPPPGPPSLKVPTVLDQFGRKIKQVDLHAVDMTLGHLSPYCPSREVLQYEDEKIMMMKRVKLARLQHAILALLKQVLSQGCTVNTCQRMRALRVRCLHGKDFGLNQGA